MTPTSTAPPPTLWYRMARGISYAGLLLGAICVVIIALATVADVAGREIFGSPIAGVVELCSVLLVMVVFLSFGAAQLEGAHIRVTLLTDRLPGRWQYWINVGVLILCSIFLLALVWISLERAVDSVSVGEQRFGLIRIPIWPARITVVVGWLIWLIALLARTAPTRDED